MKDTLKDFYIGLKSFNWSLLFILSIQLLIPAIYSTVRTYFLSTNIDVNEFDILAQIEWYDLINESVIAFLIIPQYSLLNNLSKAKSNEKFTSFVFVAGIIVCVFYSIVITILYFCVLPMIKGLNVTHENIGKTTSYLQIETIAFAIGIIYSYASVVYIVLNKRLLILLLLILKMISLIICDALLIPNAGIYGVAYSNIVVNSVMGLSAIVILFITRNIKIGPPNKDIKKLLKKWLLIGLYSGSQSILDNLIYILMVVKMINSVGNIGSYWLANNFIWNWLLIPILALSEVIKSDCKEGYHKVNHKNYYFIIFGIMIIWICLIPSWLPFLESVEKLQNAEEVFSVLIKLFWFYFAYALTVVPDGIFVGLGKTKYLLINSVIVNIGYYGIFFLIYMIGNIKMTMDLIIYMFGFGMVIHLIFSLVEEKFFLKRKVNELKQESDNSCAQN